MAAWSRKTLKKISKCLRFFGKTTPYRNFFQNSVPTGFIATPIDVLCSNFVKYGRREIGKVVRYLPNTKIRLLSSSRYCADRAKICQGQQPQTMFSECSRFHQNRFIFGGVISERVNTVRVLESESNIRLKHSFEPNNKYVVYNADPIEVSIA